MIVTSKHIIFAPPKCASTSLRYTFRGIGLDVHGSDDEGCHYWMPWPALPTVVVIRNPYERLVSMMRHFNDTYKLTLTLEQYVDTILFGEYNPIFTWNQARWLRDVNVDEYIAFEDLATWVGAEYALTLEQCNVRTEIQYQYCHLVTDYVNDRVAGWAVEDTILRRRI